MNPVLLNVEIITTQIPSYTRIFNSEKTIIYHEIFEEFIERYVTVDLESIPLGERLFVVLKTNNCRSPQVVEN